MKSLVQSSMFRETLIFAGLLSAGLALSLILPDLAHATSVISSDDNPAAVSALTGGEGDLKELIKTILNFALGFLGFVATIMVIYGGILYVTSAGNDDNVGKAKKILLYAAIGIVLIMISFALVNTILGAGLGGGTATTGVGA